ncbi:MAG: zinc ABC transporter substrate-binding protein [Phycisphaerae bacterium]|jgi:zinc transport system substrate-binding protein
MFTRCAMALPLRSTKATLPLMLAAALWLSGCERGPAPQPASASATQAANGAEPPLLVLVSVAPQAYFAERVGGANVRVECLVGPGQSPHTFEPTPRQAAQLAQARVYFTVGIPFESVLLAKLPRGESGPEIVDTRAGIELRRLTPAESAADAHEHENAQGHDVPQRAESVSDESAGAVDPHIWLDPLRVKRQARTMCDALARLAPQHSAEFERNFAAFAANLDHLHERLSKLLAPYRGREFYVFHPAYGYFADAYGLKQAPIEIEGKEPGPRALAQLIERARAAGTKVIFYQPQYSKAAAEAVARAIGASVVPLDPQPRDWLAAMDELAAALEQALAAAEAQRTEHP